jgi:hypothetical protein
MDAEWANVEDLQNGEMGSIRFARGDVQRKSSDGITTCSLRFMFEQICNLV